MRCGHNILKSKQFMCGGRFHFKHIECRTGHFARHDRVIEIVFNDQPAPRTIDDANAFLALGEGRSIHDAFGLLCHRCVKRNKIRTPENLIEFHFFNTDIYSAFRRQERVERDDFHF